MQSDTRKTILILGILAVVLAATSARPAGAQFYKVTNLVSDGSVPANTIDAGFINPWAMSASSTWWVNTQGTGFSYVVASTTGAINFKVVVPAASGVATATGQPAGSVTTGGTVGMVLPNGTKASFLFSTLDGSITGWNSKLGTAGAVTQVAINNTAAGASYPGLAILNQTTAGVTTASYILAPNFGTGNTIEVYDSTFKPTKLLAGTFTDPTLPANYAPFSIHVLGTQVFVAYAVRSATAPFHNINGPGNGIVSVFDTNGNFVSRVVTGGNLNAPWGVAYAPATFGIFSNDLLIGNLGDGIINVYDPKTFAYLGQLMDVNGKSLVAANLWELLTGGTTVTGTTAVSGGDPTTVYFTAGLANESHGLLGAINIGTTAGSTPTFGFSASTGTATVTAGNSAQATISVAPTNGFSGSVTLACSGLPAGASCNFSPSPLNIAANAPVTSTVTILTTKATAGLKPVFLTPPRGGIVAAMLFPLGSLLLWRRRRSLSGAAVSLRVLGMLVVLLAAGALIAGCTDSSTFSPPSTPLGQSTVTITGTSGAISQQTTIALTVK